MKLIPLTGKRGCGKFAAVSDEDFAFLSQWKWHQLSATCEYAVRSQTQSEEAPGNKILMHREVARRAGMDCSNQVDHRYGDTLDNCRHSIRSATRANNQHNRKLSDGTATGVKGVQLRTTGTKYCATIRCGGKQIYLGRYDSCEEAKAAYDEAARLYFGEFARSE